MTERKSVKKGTKKPAKSTTGKASTGLTAWEKAALRETIAERKAAAAGAEGERAVLAKIATMPAPDRAIAKRLHAIVKASAPGLSPKLWYGMPAYARGDKIVCFFQNAQKFKARYGTLGFNDAAHLDDAAMWPTTFALKELTAAAESRIAAIVKKAVS